jgi:hypothetical protein
MAFEPEIPWLIRKLARYKPEPVQPVEPTADSTDTPPEPNKEGVAALLLISENTVEDERERGRSIDTKTATLVGAIGLALSLNLTLGRPLLNEHLGSLGHALVVAFFIAAAVALLLALLVGVLGALYPQPLRTLEVSELADFMSPVTQARTQISIHQSMIGALRDILAQDRAMNGCKATLMKITAVLLAVGFIFVAGEALTLGVDKI